MRSEPLAATASAGAFGGSATPEILGLTADSREVRPGYLFAALPGGKLDGRRFIADAVARGAVAVLTDDSRGLDGLAVSIGAFTNLSRDHLDYHPTMAAYLAAKTRLFAEIMPSGATAVLNADVAEFAPLAATCRRRGLTVLSYGRGESADLRL